MIIGIALANFYFENGSYMEFGEQFDPAGRLLYSWKTNISSYRAKRLTCSYFAVYYHTNDRIDGNGHQISIVCDR
jgi:hypothetical protein